jgi:PH (Pleckstrin Homology) domain-containing protein
LRKGFITAGTVLMIFGIFLLLSYGPSSAVLSNLTANIYLRTLLGLVPGLILLALGAWSISRSMSRIVIPKDLKDMLGSNEKVQLYVKQTSYRPRPLGVDSWLLTNERIIHRHPHSMKLRNDYRDHSYAEINDLQFDQGVFRSKLVCDLKTGAKKMEGDILERNKSDATQGEHVSEREAEVASPFELTLLTKFDARKADGIIRENIVRFQTPFFQTPFPPDKIGYDSSQKTA